MGTDIHGVIERKWEGKWVTHQTLDMIHCVRGGEDRDKFAFPAATERNYIRFAALAGVRGEGPEARGLPDDASDTARYRFKIDGDHTPSWLPLSEAVEIFALTERNDVGEWAREFPACFYFGVEDDDLAQYRFVFWFDS